MKLRAFVFTLILIICILLSGCAVDTKSPYESSEPTYSDNTTSSASSMPDDSGDDKKPDAPTSLSIETPGGAILVGTIKKDTKGWYFEPEQTLTVKLTYYIDHPELFENLTRIEMFDYSDDGLNKTLYQDDTVTITGMLQNYRGAGTLYLYPCSVERGKTVEIGYAMPDLDYPSEDSFSYDPSIPLPTKMQPTVVNGRYEYNPYILTTDTLENMGNDFAEFYIDFVDAWLSYKTSCRCEDKRYADLFSSVMYYEFPLFSADGEYDFLTGYDTDTKTLHWSYTSKSKAEHDKLISDFKTAANGFLKNVKPSDSEQLRAQALYHSFCSAMTYDYDVMESRERVDAYYAYILNRGVCVTFACAMSQLYAQIGIEATLVSGDTSQGEGHVWNVVTIGNKNYFCDSTYELSFNSGKGFVYFGMSMQDRLNDGSGFKENELLIGGINPGYASEAAISDSSLQIK